MTGRLAPITDPVTGVVFQPVLAGAFANAVLIEWQKLDGVDRRGWRSRKAINVPLAIYEQVQAPARALADDWAQRARLAAEPVTDHGRTRAALAAQGGRL